MPPNVPTHQDMIRPDARAQWSSRGASSVRDMRGLATVVVLGIGAVFAGCGDPDPAASPSSTSLPSATTATDPVTTSSPPPPTSESGEATTTVPGAVPASTEPSSATTLQTCADVPAITTDVMGNDPTGTSFDPVFQGVLLTYAQEHPDTFGGLWIDREASGTIVLAFTDDPAPHREALAQRRPSPDDAQPIDPPAPIADDRPIGEWDIAFDVVRVEFTEAELVAASTAVFEVLVASGLDNAGVGASLTQNRVSIYPEQPITADEARSLAGAIEAAAPLSIVCLDGSVVETRPDPIAPGTPLDVIALPGADGGYPPDTPVECGGVGFLLGDLGSLTPIEQADPGLRAVVDGWIDGPEGGSWPADGWVVLTESDETATMVSIIDGAMSVISAEMGRNGWIWAGASGSGPCVVRRLLPEGMGAVEWTLDPAFPAPGPDSTELRVLVSETACTGGSELGDRLLGPQVVETADAVRIAFASIPLTGAQACPGNPSMAVTIELTDPLGERQLLDGLAIAPLADLLPAATG